MSDAKKRSLQALETVKQTQKSLRIGKLAVESMAHIVSIFAREDLANDAEILQLVERVATRYVGELSE